jgi:hypothetical protein
VEARPNGDGKAAIHHNMSSWNNETRRKAVDALASYGKKALPSLTNVAYSLLWTPEIKQYVLDKVKQINEGAI